MIIGVLKCFIRIDLMIINYIKSKPAHSVKKSFHLIFWILNNSKSKWPSTMGIEYIMIISQDFPYSQQILISYQRLQFQSLKKTSTQIRTCACVNVTRLLTDTFNTIIPTNNLKRILISYLLISRINPLISTGGINAQRVIFSIKISELKLIQSIDIP